MLLQEVWLFYSAVTLGRLSEILTEPCWLALAENLWALSKGCEKGSFSQIFENAAKKGRQNKLDFIVHFCLTSR